jgi:hypothetical protein
VAGWTVELRPAIISALQLLRNDSLCVRLLDAGRGDRAHLATENGYVRAILDGQEISFVTWLHLLDLSDANRIEASMQVACLKPLASSTEHTLSCPS